MENVLERMERTGAKPERGEAGVRDREGAEQCRSKYDP